MKRSRVAAFFSSLSFFVIAALTAGIVVGAAAQDVDAPALTGGLRVIEGLGQVWLNALRMTVIPLVFSLLVTGIVSIADAAATGRMAVRALAVFAVLLVGAVVYAILAGLGLLQRLIEGAGIEDGQQVTLLHHIALDDVHFGDRTLRFKDQIGILNGHNLTTAADTEINLGRFGNGGGCRRCDRCCSWCLGGGYWRGHGRRATTGRQSHCEHSN